MAEVRHSLPPAGEPYGEINVRFMSAQKVLGVKVLTIHENVRRRMTLNSIEIAGLVLTSVLTHRDLKLFGS